METERIVTVAQLSAFDDIIDVRSPSEFALDHIPGAINLPVLSDEERAEIGTRYKQESSFAAKRLGAALVSRNIALHLENTLYDKPRHWSPLVYCWRGGKRSGAMTHILQQVGWRAVRLDGGYRAYRRKVVEDLERLPSQFSFKVICGRTGSGKSALLSELALLGEQVLDLEGLARHRGSVLGALADPQPAQKMFESQIWQALNAFDPQRPVYVEAESQKIGDLRVPAELLGAIRTATCIRLEASVDARARFLQTDYAHFVENPQALFEKLDLLAPLFGAKKIDTWRATAAEGDWTKLVARLLDEHYDPAYLRSSQKNFQHFDTAKVVHLETVSKSALAAAAQHIKNGG